MARSVALALGSITSPSINIVHGVRRVKIGSDNSPYEIEDLLVHLYLSYSSTEGSQSITCRFAHDRDDDVQLNGLISTVKVSCLAEEIHK